MNVWTSAVCAAVGVLVVASTGAAPAVLVLKLVIIYIHICIYIITNICKYMYINKHIFNYIYRAGS